MSLPKDNGNKKLRFGCVGIRGYGGMACKLLAQHHRDGDEGIHFVAACDPQPDECADAIHPLRELGVDIATDANALLAMDLDAVWLPLPIHLHRDFTIEALRQGKAVICEKPAAGCVSEVDEMIRARDAAGLPVVVGFQQLFNPVITDVKRVLTRGELGPVKRAVVYGCWPRTRQYYQRNDWAGRRNLGRQIINDSPASNAMSHFIMLALYLIGPTHEQAAHVSRVRSHLYRAADIETYDTISMRIVTGDGVEIDVHLSHATKSVVTPTITIHAERGQVSLTDGDSVMIEKSGRTNRIPWVNDGRDRIAPTLARLIRAEPGVTCAATLENARQHVLACELASSGGAIVDVSPSIIQHTAVEQEGESAAINDLEVMISDCVRSGRLLSSLSRRE